jgi:tRNA(adenine34) deaminase
MCMTRRALIATGLGVCVTTTARAAAPAQQSFVVAAFRMKAQAVTAGDQPYGAVVVHSGEIVGWGPSRIRELGEWAGHAERVAMRDAQRRLGRENLSGCVMYSTSRPCGVCERAAVEARLARMYHGESATDAGAPR